MAEATQELAVIPEPVNGNQITSPLSLLQEAMTRGMSIDVLERFQQMYYRSQEEEAKRAYTEAMSAFKGESIVITKDKTNDQYKSKYTSLGNLVTTVTPFLSKHGLSASWDVDQSVPPSIKVTCRLRHAKGHYEEVSMIVPPDSSGQKNVIQQIKSAITYAKGCTFDSICGLASTDANVDDDGNGTRITMGDLSEKLEWINNATTLDELQRLFATAYKEAKAINDQPAMKALVAAKDAKKADLL